MEYSTRGWKSSLPPPHNAFHTIIPLCGFVSTLTHSMFTCFNYLLTLALQICNFGPPLQQQIIRFNTLATWVDFGLLQDVFNEPKCHNRTSYRYHIRINIIEISNWNLKISRFIKTKIIV